MKSILGLVLYTMLHLVMSLGCMQNYRVVHEFWALLNHSTNIRKQRSIWEKSLELANRNTSSNYVHPNAGNMCLISCAKKWVDYAYDILHIQWILASGDRHIQSHATVSQMIELRVKRRQHWHLNWPSWEQCQRVVIVVISLCDITHLLHQTNDKEVAGWPPTWHAGTLFRLISLASGTSSQLSVQIWVTELR